MNLLIYLATRLGKIHVPCCNYKVSQLKLVSKVNDIELVYPLSECLSMKKRFTYI